EIDTVIGHTTKDCIVTLVERATGYLLIGKLPDRTTSSLNKATIRLIKTSPLPVKTITADNGTEFHQYKEIEKKAKALFYFATPHHSWERGSNENANGLIRQYLPKRTSMKDVTQQHCDAIERRLNSRPRKRYGYKTPWEMKNDYA
ncbi:IS30 family transposase, partial [Alteromonas antoniana]|uniref:IS30 family transposase n=1 Tax=Alteromonas antoniana TaxID=2803813 RepID=UPI001C45B5D6